MSSIFYRHPVLYKSLIWLLYKGQPHNRYQAVAGLVPPGSKVLDVCCGTDDLFLTLKARHGAEVQYQGCDISTAFVDKMNSEGISCFQFDLTKDDLPSGRYDIIVLQGSLYQFIPGEVEILVKLLSKANSALVLSEPIRNLAVSKIPLIAWLSKFFTKTEKGPAHNRFDEKRLDETVAMLPGARVTNVSYTPGGRDKIYKIEKTST